MLLKTQTVKVQCIDNREYNDRRITAASSPTSRVPDQPLTLTSKFKLIFKHHIAKTYPEFDLNMLIPLRLVCKSFAIAFDEMVQESFCPKIPNTHQNANPILEAKEILLPYNRSLIFTGLSPSRVAYFQFAANFLCANAPTSKDQTLFIVCQTIIDKMKTHLWYFFKYSFPHSNSQIEKTTSSSIINDVIQIIKLAQFSTSIPTFQSLIKVMYSTGTILQSSQNLQSHLIDFLFRYLPKRYCLTIINQHIYSLFNYQRQFSLSQNMSYFICLQQILIKRNVMNKDHVLKLKEYIFESLCNSKTLLSRSDQTQILCLLNLLLSTGRTNLALNEIQFLKSLIFPVLHDKMSLLEMKNAVLSTILELIALGYTKSLSFNKHEIRTLQYYARDGLTYPTGALHAEQTNLEILYHLTYRQQWFFHVSARPLQSIHQYLISNIVFNENPFFPPPIVKRLTKMYWALSKHPVKTIANLALTIGTCISGSNRKMGC